MTQATFSVRDFGAVGDGVALDTSAIQRAIAAAAGAGGGIVEFPAGRYLSFTIRLRSRITLHLAAGSVLVAADPALHDGRYDDPEPPENDLYQDFGHSHWHNSLIVGIDLENIAITGPGLIHGRGLTRRGPGAGWTRGAGEMPLSMVQPTGPAAGHPRAAQVAAMRGLGNKAIALKCCRRVALRGFSVLMGGHFAVLATGVDDLEIDHVTVDTNRDGFDIDGCQRVRITHCTVNTPNDDAIVLKSSWALGRPRAVEDVHIADCSVSGFNAGSLLDGTRLRTQERSPDRDGVTGRIKIGTESSGDFRRIVITRCTFERSRGLALETVDGGVIEDVTVSDLRLDEITTAPIFLRLGNRARGPDGTRPGALRRIVIERVVVTRAESRFGSIIAGLAGHPIEAVTLRDIRIEHHGGGTVEDAQREPDELEEAYPEPSMFGTVPAHGLYARHVRGLVLERVAWKPLSPEKRPAIMLDDVADARLVAVDATGGLRLRSADRIEVTGCTGVPDTQIGHVADIVL